MLYRNCSDPRARATRDEIIKAYAELLSQRDRDYISVNDLCEASNINRTTFYRHYKTIADIEADIEDIVLSRFKVLLENTDLDDFIYGRKQFLEKVNEEIMSEIGFYSKILLANQNINFLEKINYTVREKLKATLNSKTSIPPAQIDMILTFAVAGRIAVYRKWIIDGFSPSAEAVSEILEKISSFGFDHFLRSYSEE
ncbi:MAG: TetR/AcrR family transcriptional regulator [Clostridia bacterium]|nr:TetR/AcrR family transcriptional regulator [Clostridia bacterium]